MMIMIIIPDPPKPPQPKLRLPIKAPPKLYLLHTM